MTQAALAFQHSAIEPAFLLWHVSMLTRLGNAMVLERQDLCLSVSFTPFQSRRAGFSSPAASFKLNHVKPTAT